MLDGVRILAWGSRQALRLGATLLERAGAQVTFAHAQPTGGFAYDVIVVSSDVSAASERNAIAELKAAGKHIVCDITATGQQGARAGMRASDAQIQAISGLMDTTGFAHGEPVRIGVPFTEISAALYACASIAAAVRVKRLHGIAQTIDVTLFGCAASALTTFLPAAFAQRTVGRVGNRHPACAPWNAYRTLDGWILICTSTEEQWRKIKSVARVPQLDDSRFDTLRARVSNVDELDALIETWTSTLTTDECSHLCEQIGVAAGPIVSVAGLSSEPNFRMRHADAAAQIDACGIDAETYRQMSIFSLSRLTDDASLEQRAGVESTVRSCDAGPLAGIKVVEIGQYTTAPLVGKHLAALGAEVVKIEPPDGEVARAWTPGQAGTSYFFALNNTDKQTLALDLKQQADRAHLRTLLADADVLVENLRPGALAKLGFGREALGEINPRLIYCSISGFGIASAYPARPAFDTVIQAMGGLMDLTRGNGQPVKLGASGADILGGQAALLAILALLADPARQAGTFVEISMQDVAAWCALFASGNPEREGIAVACIDGHVWLESDERFDVAALAASARRERCGSLSRASAVAALANAGVSAVPVARVDELIEDGDFLADVLSVARDASGAFWPILKVPYRLSRTPARVRAVPGAPARYAEETSRGSPLRWGMVAAG
ncbi:CaiB/BaiF CoA-transferase family protein [Paraburkholderia hospita]|uniref:CoA transferase n=1 Tax=Paraburkholderia hospita TaxID=169430 RepID=A0AAN1MKI4_9BURK|nr:CoA transferase [Paraburkholderia hospita]AUT70466.1 CoA transferase [Paraburkholderia hospita]EIM99916.1 L-carnitine dehydratase/bile acid-inducible protein F [Paraburkholderia hospita]OUL86274.1 CoA transferase [Paraburkholderia hospita]OUL88332.1 CoA transferase [Paraburkholderia hospita]SEH54686.1 Crotonobetainyl-CoA:carnitine CoA-transferase CaiB [Paraburkholderia hospita]